MSIFNKKKYNILVLGSDGMLGYDVYEHFKTLSSQRSSQIGVVTGITKADNIDVTERHMLGTFFQNSIHYDYCINCIAYTDTEKAETDKHGYLESYSLNVLAPKYIAESCDFWKVKLIHISTDYVFSEYSKPKYSATFDPYDTLSDVPFPINVYGMHKLIGEHEIANAFSNEKNYTILRTSWLYGIHKNKSFVHKFMKNVVKTCMNASADEESKGPISVEVNAGECSIPTSTEYIVYCLDQVIAYKEHGIMHAVPVVDVGSDVPSRYDFAHAILTQFAGEFVNGIDLDEVAITDLTKMPENQYRPAFSALQSSFDWTVSWQKYLEKFIAQNKKSILEYAIKENTK